MLSIDQLNCFVALAESGSFHGAAASLNCSQPTISQRLRRLEEDLQANLVHRGHTGCELSTAGRRFLPLAQSILSIAQQADDIVRNKCVRVAACSNIGIYSLPPLIAAFSDTLLPRESCTYWLGTNPDAYDRLVRAEADVAIMEWWQETDGFAAQVFAEDPLVLITPPGHALASQKRIANEDLLTLPLLGGERGTGTGRLLRKVLGRQRNRLKPGVNLGSTEAVKRAVRSGLGVSVVLASSVKDEIASGVLIACPIDHPAAKKSFHMAYRSDLHEADLPRRLVRFLSDSRSLIAFPGEVPKSDIGGSPPKSFGGNAQNKESGAVLSFNQNQNGSS